MFCPKCGTKLNGDEMFCGECGNPMNNKSKATAQPQSAPQAPVAPQPQATPKPPVTPQTQASPQPRPIFPEPVIPPQPQATPKPPITPQTQASPQPRPIFPETVIPPQPQATPKPPVAPQTQASPQPRPNIPAPVKPPQPQAQAAPKPAAVIPPQQAAPRPQPIPQPIPQAQADDQPFQQKPLQYTVFGGNLPAVSIRLDAGECIYTQSGGVMMMSSGITMTTNMQGGIIKGLGRMFSGESLFMAAYTSNAPNQEVIIASTSPGNIIDIDVSQQPLIAQKSAFLCAQPGVVLSEFVTGGLSAGLFGGEGFIMQRLTGIGKVFLEIDGSIVARTLAPGEIIKVDTGNVAAFEETVNYQTEMIKGFKNILFGGEGLFLATLTGPGRVWLQTMTMPGFAKEIIPFLPKPSSD